MKNKEKEVEQMRVPNHIIQKADDMSKETRLPFRDCLDVLMGVYLADEDRRASREIETADGVVRSRANHVLV